MTVTHISFYLGLGSQGGNRIDNDQVYGTRPHQHIGNFQGLFTRVGL